ncbi:putative glicosidase [Auriculariales sp. MPI-PUGE-AT-0066]|nr:putative glicosidase [Auriculariales sp. MPI-PUGE-AT-0066]
MPVIERDLNFFEPASPVPTTGSTISSFVLVSSDKAIFKGFTYTLSFRLPSVYSVLLVGPDRPQPPHDNIVLSSTPLQFKLVSLDIDAHKAVFAFPDSSSREIHLAWIEGITLDVFENGTRLFGDTHGRSYALTGGGVIRHWRIERDNVHLGMGERAGPLNLTNRSFLMHAADSAFYDTYESDPLYKHTPFLISMPRPTPDGKVPLSTYAIYHPTNTNSRWDVGRMLDHPFGAFKSFEQDYGGLEEWVLVGKDLQEIVSTFAELVGKPKLVGRDWLGYLASGMGLGESDEPIAQELLSGWPDLCKKHDIPCSAMHLSSGYTVGEADGNRYVFNMNKKRYPDFKGMVGLFHKAGIKVVPNIKPYALATHQNYNELHAANALFHDPFTSKPVVTSLWSSAVGMNAKGSWVDMTSQPGRDWWYRGVQSLIELGVDGAWDDNNEYFLHDDAYVCANDLEHKVMSPTQGPTTVGLMGRMFNTELMNKASHDAIVAANPERRPYVLTRSANVGAFKYANTTWSGDNETSWKNLRGSQPIQMNAGLSLMQSYGSDVGGFGGVLPSPELFTRWVQLGVTHSRFCIHSYKPDLNDPSGAAQTNTPWMYPEVLPIVRKEIKWRYEHLPYFNALMWESHRTASPPLAPLFFGPFASDPRLYEPDLLDGFDAWIGVGRLLSTPALYEGMLSRPVYFPKASSTDDTLYFDLNMPYARYTAGQTATISTPLEHMGLFAREGAAVPIGKDYATVTALSGPARTHVDGVDVLLESEGGVVGLDDWRGVYIFPGSKDDKSYVASWTEDDGISSKPDTAEIEVTYCGKADAVEVKARWIENKFKPLWDKTLHVLLPVGDVRSVIGATQVVQWRGRPAHVVEIM